MQLKRHFAKPDGWQRRVNARLPNGQLMVPSMGEGDCINPPPLAFIELQHTGTAREQNFSEALIMGALRDGWASFDDGGVLLLQVQPETLRYTVKRTPGRYCVHCHARLPDNDPTGEQSRAHVAAEHKGVTSPDPAWPSGYAVIHAYECVLDSAQHEKFKKRVAKK